MSHYRLCLRSKVIVAQVFGGSGGRGERYGLRHCTGMSRSREMFLNAELFKTGVETTDSVF